MTTRPYHIRPGGLLDVPRITDLYMSSFANDQILDILCPSRHEYPQSLTAYVYRKWVERWWTPNYNLTILADNATGTIVGYTWWKRPTSELSFYERWISPYAWFAPVARAILALYDWLFPIPHFDEHAASVFFRVIPTIESNSINTPRRKSAWYLSTLCVDPELQGKGLGSMVLRHGLDKADECGAATWLIGVKGIDHYYERHGFKEVGRANIGEMSHWEGGSIMFRNE